jgi:hypothetical protein
MVAPAFVPLFDRSRLDQIAPGANDEWAARYLPTIRIATVLLTEDVAGLTKILEGFREQGLPVVLWFESTTDELERLATLVRVASERVLIAERAIEREPS